MRHDWVMATNETNTGGGNMTTKTYEINYWGSHPENNNDDCWYGEDFDSFDAAMSRFTLVITDGADDSSVAWIELTGPGVYRCFKSRNYRPEPDDDDEWRREQAREAGMLGGCDAYNDAMGY